VASSVLLFFFELFLPEGLADVSAEDSALVGFSVLVDLFELLCRGETGDAPFFAFASARVALPGDALALAAADAVADADALGEALTLGVVWVCALSGAAAKPRMVSAAPLKRDTFMMLYK
jgi:hypothetical protein